MTADDKCGIGAGLLALGLAGGIILLAQLLPNDLPLLPFGLLSLPHRELVTVEAIFDGVLAVTCLPSGIYLLYRGAIAGKDEGEGEGEK